jgi:Na+/melibiose symporter-like transporter
MRVSTTLTLVLTLLLTASPAYADDGVTGFWITLQPAAPAAVLILFGAFCALWAQNTGRNAWSWFFLGLAFSVITVAVLLFKNAEDRRTRQ